MSVRTWQGTTQVNNLVVNGNFTANDLKYIQTYVGPMPALKRFATDAAGTGLPVNLIAGYMKQRASKTSMILEYRLVKGDTSEFDAAPTIVAAGTMVDIPANEIVAVCAKAKIEQPLGTNTLMSECTPAMTTGQIQFFEGQNVFLVLEEGTATGLYNVDVYYEDMAYPISTDTIQYGWSAVDVTVADLVEVFDLFLGTTSGGITQLLDASSFFKLSSTSAL